MSSDDASGDEEGGGGGGEEEEEGEAGEVEDEEGDEGAGDLEAHHIAETGTIHAFKNDMARDILLLMTPLTQEEIVPPEGGAPQLVKGRFCNECL